MARTVAVRRKKFEEIAEHLELMIFSGKLAPGDRIPSERALMERFGAGRSSVREATFALQRKGLLSSRPGAAARVSTPTPDGIISELTGPIRHYLNRPQGIRDLQNARALLEIGLTRSAALNATAADLAVLKKALEDNGMARDQETFARTDMVFHYTLAMISHNEIFTSLNMALNEWLAEQRSLSAKAGARFNEMYGHHAAIFDAIAARDAVAAEAAMERHLDAVSRYYWQVVSKGLSQ